MFNVNHISQITREQEEEVRLQIWAGIAILIGGISVMWVINITGIRFLNILIAFIAMAAIAMVGSKTKVLIGFSLAGLIFSRLQSKSESGILTGLGWLLDLMVAVAFVFALSAFVLTSLNFSTAPGSFLVMVLGAMTGTLAHLFYKKDGTAKSCVLIFVCLVVTAAGWQPMKATLSEYFDFEKKEETQKQHRPYRYSVQQTSRTPSAIPTNALTEVQVPSCSSGRWAKVDIPPGWNVNLPWNKKAAYYTYRSVKTSQWETSPPAGGADAVRLCALHEPYAGDSMPVTWLKR